MKRLRGFWMKCIDTTYFVDIIRRPGSVRKLTEKLDAEGVHATTTINVFEAMFGAFAIGGEKGEKIRRKLTEAFSRVEVLEFSYRDAVLAAEIGGRLRKRGRHVGLDVITAAIAINNGCESVVTRNEKHFKWIEEETGLKVEAYEV